jgi:putative transposase
MPRQVRIEYPGATYHVMCRGDRREAIYEDDDDRRMFLATLAECVKRTGWLVHAYVLMGNHYHLVIETPEPNLVRGMAWVQTTYTARFNARHHLSGHVFGGRYKAILVDPEDPRYLATLLDYIHLNPVRAGLIRLRKGGRLLGYPWSSLSGYARLRERPVWLQVERGLGAKEREDTVYGRRRLIEELERRAAEVESEKAGLSMVDEQNLQSTLRRGWYYGRSAFRDWLLDQADKTLKRRRAARKNYHGSELREHNEAMARRLIEEGLKKARLSRKELQTLPKGDARKARIAGTVRATTTVPLQWLADELQMGTASNISHACRRHASASKV